MPRLAPVLLRRALLACTLLTAACGPGNPAPEEAPLPVATTTKTPKLRTVLQPAQLQMNSRDAALHIDVTVMVDPDGMPDMTTLRLVGYVTDVNRQAITEWIARSEFDPALEAGVPVRAEFHATIKSQTPIRHL